MEIRARHRGLPFLLYRDGSGEQAVYELGGDERVTIGRRAANDIALPLGLRGLARARRARAPGRRVGRVRRGLSHNGTFVNGERVRGRRALRGGDVISVGDTPIAFCAAPSRSTRGDAGGARPRAARSR